MPQSMPSPVRGGQWGEETKSPKKKKKKKKAKN